MGGEELNTAEIARDAVRDTTQDVIRMILTHWANDEEPNEYNEANRRMVEDLLAISILWGEGIVPG